MKAEAGLLWKLVSGLELDSHVVVCFAAETGPQPLYHRCLRAHKHTLSCALCLDWHLGFFLTGWYLAELRWPWQREP